ncbi:transposase [Pistricoccus aurantiacus]|uniref:Transposase n=1 Tax=Pistricoccus aurantiacus TaxID=1883414 RepID=A0A5B8SQN4_9GAMM|nr:transposase [Pistricoccus aurantiacus]QEA38534.1 transposase [Pistricoccus aurantiacus]
MNSCPTTGNTATDRWQAVISGRLRFTAKFKARIVNACQQPDASVAGIAMAHALNANLVHKWIREARRSAPVSDTPAFVPVPMASTATPAAGQHREAERIRL